MERRTFLSACGAGAAAAVVPAAVVPTASAAMAAGAESPAGPNSARPAKGRLRQSVCRWCYGGFTLEQLCANASRMGYESVELLTEKEWSVPAAHGLTCAVAMGPNPITRGWNRVEHHDEFVKEGERLLPLVKAAGIPNMIVFSGNREGMGDAEAIANCVKGLKRLTPMAESMGVTIVMELLSSKDHGDYHADRTWWGVKVWEGVASERFKLLYDIYHMQRMEGDVIATIQENIKAIGHFHTGGVPGRNEIDESQELRYETICKAIAETGYAGFLGQEFIPRRDPMASLEAAYRICAV